MPKFELILNSSLSNDKSKGQILMKIYEFQGKLIEKGIQSKKIVWIGLKIREKSLFENQQNSATKFERNDENSDSSTLITYLNLIKTI